MPENEIYNLLGRFLVQFEQLNHYAIGCIRTILLREGLTNENIQEIILARLTAEPLRDMLYSLCGEFLKPDTDEAKILSKLFDDYKKIINLRNDILHSSWSIASYENDGGDLAFAIREKLHRNRKGSATKRDVVEIKELIQITEKAKDCSDKFSQLLKCLSFNHSLKSAFNLEKNKLTLNYIILRNA